MFGIEKIIERSLASLESMENGAMAIAIVSSISYLESIVKVDIVLNYYSADDDLQNVNNSLKLLGELDLVSLFLMHGEWVILTLKTWQNMIREHIRRKGMEEEILRQTFRMVQANLTSPNMLHHAIYVARYAVTYESICNEFYEIFFYINVNLKAIFTAGILPYGKKVFSYFQSILGDCFPSILSLHIRLSCCLVSKDQPKDALEMLMPFFEEETLERRELFGTDLWLEASFTFTMLLIDVDRCQDALLLLHSHIFQYLDASQESDRKKLQSWHQLAILLDHTQHYTESLQMLEKLLKRQEEILNKDDDDIMVTKSSMASVYKAQKSYPKALEMYMQVLCDRQKKLGPDHPDTLRTERDIAPVHFFLGDKEKSLTILRKVSMKMDVILGKNHPDTLEARAYFGSVLEQLSQNKEALEVYEDVYKRCSNTLGPKHIQTLKLLENISSILVNLGKMTESINILQEVLIAYKDIFGEGSKHSMRVKNCLEVNKVLLKFTDATFKDIDVVFSVTKSGDFEEFKLFLQMIDDINVTNDEGKTLLHVASEYGHLNIVKALLEKGCIYDSRSKEGETPAQLAQLESIQKVFQTVSTLFDAVKSGKTQVIINELKSRELLLNPRDSNGCTLAHWAALKRNADILKMLLEKGLNPEVTSLKGNTPLHIAAKKGRSDIIELILSFVTQEHRPAFINKRTANGGNTAIHAAAQNGFIDAVTMLVNHGGAFDILNRDGKTPLAVTSDTKVRNLLQVFTEMNACSDSSDVNVDLDGIFSNFMNLEF